MSDTPVPLLPAVAPKRKGRWLVRIVTVLLIALFVLVWLAPGLLARSGYKDRLVADLTTDVHGTVRVGEVSLNWLHPVEVFDVSVTDADGRPVLSAKKVSTSKTLFDLVLNRADLGTLRVEQPLAELRFEHGTTNVEQAFAKYLEPAVDTPPARTPISVEVADGIVRLTDTARNQSTELTAVGGNVTIPADRAEPITFRLTATAGGPITVDGEVGGGGKVSVEADEFDLAAVAPAVRHFAPDTVVGGKLRSTLSGTWAATDGGLSSLTVEGDTHLTDLTLAAPALGPDPVRLATAEVPLSATFDGKTVRVKSLRVTCDVGTAGFAGEYDTTAAPEQFLNQTGLAFNADVDLAKLGAVAPGLLRLKPGTELTHGRLTANVTSAAGDTGVTWSGSVVTHKIEGQRDGRTVAWEQPLSVRFAGRIRPDGLPAFDTLVVQSDFIGAQARGEPESFDAVANIDLTRLGGHLNDLLDLNGLKLQGYAKELRVTVRPNPAGGYTLTAGGAVQNLAVSDNTGVLVSDPNLTLSAKAEGDIRDGTVRVDSGKLDVTAGADTLGVSLVEPIADLKAFATGKATVTLTGDLNRWRGRVGQLVGWPGDWEIGGTATEATAVVSLGDVVSAESVKLGIENAHFRGVGLAVDEPTLRIDTATGDEPGRVTFDPTTGAVAFTRTAVSSRTINGAVAHLDLTPNAKGEYGAKGKANVVTRLDRLQKTLQLQSARDLSDQFRGVATGAVELTAETFDRLDFKVDLAINGFAFGQPTAPTWSEPWVKVRGGVGYQLSADTLFLADAVVERDGFTASGSGTVAKLSTAVELDVSGTLGYDLAKVEPVLREYLGKTATASGTGTKPFRLTGSAADPTKLRGSAELGWTSLRAYGFDVGKGELTAAIDRGVLTSTPVTATFGGGTVTAEPTVRLTPGAYDLSFKPGRVVDKATLTPEVCAEAIGYALPAIANAAQADGVMSFDLAENRFPLADPAAGSFTGTLTIHEGAVSPGPVITEILTALDVKSPSLQLTKGNAVPIEMKNGRVTHSNFVLLVGNTPVTTSGSVGTDGTLQLTVSVPVGGSLAEKLFPNRPILQKAVARQTVNVKVGGTLTKPQFDAAGMQGQLTAIVEGALKDAAREAAPDLVDDLLKKGLNELFKKK